MVIIVSSSLGEGELVVFHVAKLKIETFLIKRRMGEEESSSIAFREKVHGRKRNCQENHFPSLIQGAQIKNK